MTMAELSQCYKDSGDLLRQRIRELKQQRKTERDPERIWNLNRRIEELSVMLREMNTLAELTEHYYDRGFWRSEIYTV